MALLSACWATAWTLALIEVTSVSPVCAGVPPTVLSTSPAAFTETIWRPRLAGQVGVVLGLKAGLADQVVAGEAGLG